jgi:hypothetical protein
MEDSEEEEGDYFEGEDLEDVAIENKEESDEEMEDESEMEE